MKQKLHKIAKFLQLCEASAFFHIIKDHMMQLVWMITFAIEKQTSHLMQKQAF